ncbi:hypothetical protein AVEN_241322-1 [Araneus ventricosus]|uniref:Uncharacterized protein n=1 Tax=Araneus ventricosus TaxID=182803 RepID=A0A4Y2EEF8_ARAVE|nr:hypothetical protein AVEN_241322-1 [Araneus ventricosus]
MHTAKPASEALFEPSSYPCTPRIHFLEPMTTFNTLVSKGISESFTKQSRSARQKNSSFAPERPCLEFQEFSPLGSQRWNTRQKIICLRRSRSVCSCDF